MKNVTYVLFAMLPIVSWAQPSVIIEGYVQEAISSNHALKQKNYQYEKALKAVEEARKLYYPDANFSGSYTLAAGGRKIDFPIGDLLNPVYGTLNALTQSNSFPQLENQEIQFLPNNFYDVKVRVQAPLWSNELKLLNELRKRQTVFPQLEAEVYKRELIKEVKMAYLRYLQANEAVAIFEQGLTLLAEARRTTESLVRNDVAIPSQLIRIQGDVAAVENQKLEMEGNRTNAAAYLNMLCNRAWDAPVPVDSMLIALPQLPDGVATDGRTELEQLRQVRDLQQLLSVYEQKFYVPKIGAFTDLGSQAFAPDWGGYVLAGVSIEMPLWDNKRHNIRQQQAELDVKATDEQILHIRQQLDMQARTTHNSLKTSLLQYEKFGPQLDAANRAYRDVFKLYKEGKSGYLELLDARTQITNIALQQSIARYQTWLNFVEFERAVAQ